jgi:hypothetical protein
MNTTSLASARVPSLPKTPVADAALRAMRQNTIGLTAVPAASGSRAHLGVRRRPPAASSPLPRRKSLPTPMNLRASAPAPMALAPARDAAPPAAGPGSSDAVTQRHPQADRLVATAEALAVQVRTARPHGGESLLGATAVVAPRQRPSIYAVRCAVSTPRTREDSLTEIDLHEANRVLERLQRPLGAARGHKFAVGIRRTTDGTLDAAAVCAAPTAASLHDGLTTELRRLAVGADIVDGCARLLDGIADEASRMGYRRLVTYLRVGLTAQVLVDAGWSRLPACRAGGATDPNDGRGHDAGPAWTKVLRGEHRSR